MKIAGIYSFYGGVDAVASRYSDLLEEVENCILAIDASQCKTKRSKEKTMRGAMLYAPKQLNSQFKEKLCPINWQSIRVSCDYPTLHYVKGYEPKQL